MIRLFSFGPRFGVQDLSPFVLKVDAYLRMADIPFEAKMGGFGNLKKSPKGKLPYIQDGDQQVSDSFFIFQHLQQNHFDMDRHLTDEQRAIANLTIRALDESLYWCLVYTRWIREDSWNIVKSALFKKMPFPLRYIAPFVARRRIQISLAKQGMGRHSDKEILAIGRDILQDLSVLLGDKPYFFGDKPSSLDAAAYGFLAQVILSELDSAMKPIACEFTNLVNFCQRIQDEFYAS